MNNAGRVSSLPDYDWGQLIPPKPELGEPSRLDRYVSKICDRIRCEGLKSLYWISGIYTHQIGYRLFRVLLERTSEPGHKSSDRDLVILVRPAERQLAERFGHPLGHPFRSMREGCEDSFLVVNDTVVLDLTPAAAEYGKPEFIEDALVAAIYVGRFKELESGSIAIGAERYSAPAGDNMGGPTPPLAHVPVRAAVEVLS